MCGWSHCRQRGMSARTRAAAFSALGSQAKQRERNFWVVGVVVDDARTANVVAASLYKKTGDLTEAKELLQQEIVGFG